MTTRNHSIIIFIYLILYPAMPVYPGSVLTWTECVKIAEKNNPELIAAGENVNKAEAAVGIVRSPMLPQVNVNSSVSKSKAETDYGTVKQNNFSYGIQGSQMLFDGMKTFSDVDKSKEELAAVRYRYLTTSSNLRLSLRGAYISIIRAQENIVITKKIMERRKQNYDLVKLRYEAGREHRGSLLTAEADYAQSQFDMKSAERNLEISWERLFKSLGINKIPVSSAVPDFSISENTDMEPDFTAIAEKNPLLVEMTHLYEAAKYNVKSSKLDFFPKVYGFLNFGQSNSQWPPDKTAWSVGVQASLPLVEGGRGIYETKRAMSDENYYRAEVKNVRDTVLFTLRQKWIAFQTAAENVSINEKYLKAAEERSKIAEAQYGIGLLTFDSWIIIENTFVLAMNNYLSARINALAWAEVIACNDIFIGVNAVDYSGYPDCRPLFIRSFEDMANVGTKAGVEGRRYTIHAPLIEHTKATIIKTGIACGIDYGMTHSCYDPSPEGLACGACDSCQIRKKGFADAGVPDPTHYV